MNDLEKKACNCKKTPYAILWDINCPVHRPQGCPFCPIKDAELTALRADVEHLSGATDVLADEVVRTENRYKLILRRIAGELGEFADADGETMIEKIRFLRKDYDETVAALRAEVERKDKLLARCRAWFMPGDRADPLIASLDAELRRRAGKEG